MDSGNKIEQFASQLVDFSSQYGNMSNTKISDTFLIN